MHTVSVGLGAGHVRTFKVVPHTTRIIYQGKGMRSRQTPPPSGGQKASSVKGRITPASFLPNAWTQTRAHVRQTRILHGESPGRLRTVVVPKWRLLFKRAFLGRWDCGLMIRGVMDGGCSSGWVGSKQRLFGRTSVCLDSPRGSVWGDETSLRQIVLKGPGTLRSVLCLQLSHRWFMLVQEQSQTSGGRRGDT